MSKVTGPATSKAKEPFIELAQASDGWRWRLWSGTGRAMADSAEAYPDKKHALQAVRAVPEILAAAKLIVQSSPDE